MQPFFGASIPDLKWSRPTQPMKDPEGLTANITSERPMQRSSVTAESVSPRENQPSPLDLHRTVTSSLSPKGRKKQGHSECRATRLGSWSPTNDSKKTGDSYCGLPSVMGHRENQALMGVSRQGLPRRTPARGGGQHCARSLWPSQTPLPSQ